MRFGGNVALDGVSFDMMPGRILGLIGPNGAGKTTLFNCLSRLYRPSCGEIRFKGRTILDQPANRIAGLGIGRTFQNLALFPTLTVVDNVRIGGHVRSRGDLLSDALRLPWARRQERQLDEAAGSVIEELGLAAERDRLVGTLPFGTRKRVELARALMTGPDLLLLDEPAAGLNQEEVSALGEVISGIHRARRIAILLVEHHMGLVMSTSETIVALSFGRKIAEGTPAAIQRDPAVIDAYLGTREH